MDFLMPLKTVQKSKQPGWTMIDSIFDRYKTLLEYIGGEWYANQKLSKRKKIDYISNI